MPVYGTSYNPGDSGHTTVHNALDAMWVVQTITNNYTMLATDGIVLASGTITITLPTIASATQGRRHTVKNNGSGVVTIVAQGGALIDGSSSIAIATSMNSLDFFHDGNNWWVV